MANAAVDGIDTSGDKGTADPRVLIAADKFKGTLTAVEVAERVTAGLRRVRPGLEVEALPVA
ncbi:glycerate kinase, partial [Streptomyces caniscabiei]|uniref:glycerate kinase n=1 Tax=Streptomyces caniscabiei TaxID=2746961 RepID=UPI000A4B0633